MVEPDEREVFQCVSGKALAPGMLGNLVHAHLKASGVAKTGSWLPPVPSRHGDAQARERRRPPLRPAGARAPRLNTAEICTHVNIQKLIVVQRLSHPAKLPEPRSGVCQPDDTGHTLPA